MEKRIKEIMEDVFECDFETISDDTTADNTPQWDSLNHLCFITALEKEFNINLSIEEISSIISYKTVCEVVSKHIKR